VLIGAGCSVTAKIPAVGGIIDYIREEYRAECVAWGYVLKGLARMDEADAEDSYAKFAEAIGFDQEALKIKPDMAEAHFNWGYALGALSKLKNRELFDEARAVQEGA